MPSLVPHLHATGPAHLCHSCTRGLRPRPKDGRPTDRLPTAGVAETQVQDQSCLRVRVPPHRYFYGSIQRPGSCSIGFGFGGRVRGSGRRGSGPGPQESLGRGRRGFRVGRRGRRGSGPRPQESLASVVVGHRNGVTLSSYQCDGINSRTLNDYIITIKKGSIK